MIIKNYKELDIPVLKLPPHIVQRMNREPDRWPSDSGVM